MQHTYSCLPITDETSKPSVFHQEVPFHNYEMRRMYVQEEPSNIPAGKGKLLGVSRGGALGQPGMHQGAAQHLCG